MHNTTMSFIYNKTLAQLIASARPSTIGFNSQSTKGHKLHFYSRTLFFCLVEVDKNYYIIFLWYFIT